MISATSVVTVLIVDDEPTTLETVSALLTGAGYQIVLANNGKEALEKIETEAPDVIILDVMMPEMDGFEVCRLIKANPEKRHIPVILFTALNDRENLVQGLNAGADEFLSKPISGMELRARVRTMLRIKKQHDELVHLMSLREDLVNMMVHDLRSPLNVISLCAGGLEPAAGETPENREMIELMVFNTQRLTHLLSDLLVTAKMRKGQLQLNRDKTDLPHLLKETVQGLSLLARDRKLSISCKVPDGEFFANIDGELMTRVLDNLLLNALKFSPSGSTITICLEHTKKETTETIRFRFLDQGPGISEADRTRVFEPFETVQVQKRGITQIGLGLTFCKMVVEAHQGKIWVEANQPKGAAFIVELPVHPVA